MTVVFEGRNCFSQLMLSCNSSANASHDLVVAYAPHTFGSLAPCAPTVAPRCPSSLGTQAPHATEEGKRKNVPVLWEALSTVPGAVLVVPCTRAGAPRGAGFGEVLWGRPSHQRCWPTSLLVVTMAAALFATVVVFLLRLLLAGSSG